MALRCGNSNTEARTGGLRSDLALFGDFIAHSQLTSLQKLGKRNCTKNMHEKYANKDNFEIVVCVCLVVPVLKLGCPMDTFAIAALMRLILSGNYRTL